MFDPDWPLVALAAEDVLPVILSVAGFVVLADLASSLGRRAGRWVWAGTVLIGVGGLTKPVYKSALALTGGSIDWLVLDDVLFWLLAPGFLLAGEGLRTAAGVDAGDSPQPRTALAVGAVAAPIVGGILAVSMPERRSWFLALLGIATLGNLWVVAILTRWAARRRDPVAASLFVLNIVVVFGLAGAAAVLEQTIPVQWGEQLAATAAQGAFLWAAVRLRRRVHPRAEQLRSRSGP